MNTELYASDCDRIIELDSIIFESSLFEGIDTSDTRRDAGFINQNFEV